MNKRFSLIMASAAATVLTIAPAMGQTSSEQQSTTRERLGSILGALFGDRAGQTASIEAQWAAGQTPLTNQRVQFESRVDTEVRGGALSQATGTRLKADYRALVELETRYGADRRFTTQERRELADRYGTLTQVFADGRYADGATGERAMVGEGRAEFDRRVDAQVSARRLTRTAGTRLKSDYAALIPIETRYLSDGILSTAERADLEARLDALDARVGDVSYATTPQTPRDRLSAIARAIPSSGLSNAVQAQLRTEHEDISRLEAAYARLTMSADERAYLERRLAELETRVRIR